jgi:hypothetical protein
MAVVCLLGAPALATVGPPVKIRMAPDTRQAASGHQFAGAIEIHVGRPGTVDNITIEGEGWTLQQIERPAGPRQMQPGVVRIPFRARPANADKPIRVSLTYEGRRIARTFELGPGYFARAGRPEPLQPIPGTSGVRPAPAAGQGVKPPADSSEQATPQGQAPSSVTIVGRLVYQRPMA